MNPSLMIALRDTDGFLDSFFNPSAFEPPADAEGRNDRDQQQLADRELEHEHLPASQSNSSGAN
jgi:hypothetical protein